MLLTNPVGEARLLGGALTLDSPRPDGPRPLAAFFTITAETGADGAGDGRASEVTGGNAAFGIRDRPGRCKYAEYRCWRRVRYGGSSLPIRFTIQLPDSSIIISPN